MSGLLRGALALVMVALLGACASMPSSPAVVPGGVPVAQAEAAQRERAGLLAAIPAWALQGRVAISNGARGGSGRMEWAQDGRGYAVSLAAPVTRQSWRLEVAADGYARLEGLEGGDRQGPDADRLLREATGWEIPVDRLGDWVRGLPQAGRDEVSYGEDGRLRRIDADGWTIEYQEWLPPADGFPAMPRRLQAVRGEARVRLVLDGWQGRP